MYQKRDISGFFKYFQHCEFSFFLSTHGLVAIGVTDLREKWDHRAWF